MLEQLKFVQGSVAKKEFLPALTHFVIENGTVRGYNGMIAICSPIPLDIACKPKAAEMVRAIMNCDETVQMKLTPAGRLSIKSGSYKTLVDCADGETPHVLPSGQTHALDGSALRAGLKAVYPFIGKDASRPWCGGVLVNGPSLFATNNVTLVEFWVGVTTLPHVVNLPKPAIDELLRLGEPPTHVQVDDNSVTFHFAGNRWLRTQLLESNWPDLSKVLDLPCDPQPIDPRIFEALKKLQHNADKLERVMFKPDMLCTHNDQDEERASFDIPGLNVPGVFNISMLKLLEGAATHVDFSTYPRPCMWRGERMRGAIVGMRA